MLEYSIDEADALLSKNLAAATRNLKEIEDDLGFLRDQYTTTEVSILYMLSVEGWFAIIIYQLCEILQCVKNAKMDKSA